MDFECISTDGGCEIEEQTRTDSRLKPSSVPCGPICTVGRYGVRASTPQRRRIYVSYKEAFAVKLRCPVMDLAETFDLIGFQQDRWIFNTVKAAIAAGVKNKMRALRCKPGFPGFSSACADLHRQLHPAPTRTP